MVDPQQVTHVIYHSPCDDGFGAAWSAWKLLGSSAHYLPAQHGGTPPDLPADAVVALVDFTYPRSQLEIMRAQVRDLVVLDHHVTAQDDLEGLPCAIFDMDRSGAHLAWDFFHPGKPLPDLLAYVEDKDLWRFRLKQSREVTAALRSYPMDFELWDSFRVEDLKAEGVSLLRLQEQTVMAHCRRYRWDTLGGHHVPLVNATDYRSEICNRLCSLHPDAPFAAAYFDNEEGFRSWSLRSIGSFNVAQLAQNFGGGGHPKAAGFTEKSPVPPPPSR